MQITITKTTSQPGEVTTITAFDPGSMLGDLRLGISRMGRAIDWRVRTENEKKLENTRRNLRKHGLKLPGF